jgi:hypothetical protein
MHHHRVIVLGVVSGLLACGDGKAPTPSAGTCDLADGRKVPVGAMYADGCNCCMCLPERGVCQGAACRDPVDGGTPGIYWTNPMHCRGDADCATAIYPRAWCVFDQGCSPGEGHCVNTYYDVCIGGEGTSYDYCGCDGQTFTLGKAGVPAHPDRPYAYVGKCR